MAAHTAPHLRFDGQQIGIVRTLAVGGMVAAAGIDATAQRIALYAAAVLGAWALWQKLIVPLGSLLKHGVAVVKKTAEALDALEHLPERWKEQEKRDQEKDERIAAVEAEVGIVHADVINFGNELRAVRRELGIGDDRVRRPPTVT